MNSIDMAPVLALAVIVASACTETPTQPVAQPDGLAVVADDPTLDNFL